VAAPQEQVIVNWGLGSDVSVEVLSTEKVTLISLEEGLRLGDLRSCVPFACSPRSSVEGVETPSD